MLKKYLLQRILRCGIILPQLGRRGVSFNRVWDRERNERAQACFFLSWEELRKHQAPVYSIE